MEFELGKTYTFKAILTGIKRDTQTLSPKTLITNVESDGHVFRDHCWVETNHRLMKLVPQAHNKRKVRVTFTARVEEYMSSEGTKVGLRHIRNVGELSKLRQDFKVEKPLNIIKIKDM